MSFKINRLLLIIIMVFLSIVQSCDKRHKNKPLYIKLSDQITKITAKELQNEKGLILVGEGGELMYDVKKLFMSFHADDCRNLSDARSLIIYCANKYLKNINSDVEIQQYLHNRPFTSRNIKISIFFNDDKLTQSQFLNGVSLSRGIIRYYVPKEDKLLSTYYSENYEEAVKALEQLNSNEKSQFDKEVIL